MTIRIALFAALFGSLSVAGEPVGDPRPEMLKAPARKAPEVEEDKRLVLLDTVRDLVQNDAWLADLVTEAANTGKRNQPKLPDGVSVTVASEPISKNPFNNPFRGKHVQKQASMKPVTSRTAIGKRGQFTAIMWVDERKLDVSKLR